MFWWSFFLLSPSGSSQSPVPSWERRFCTSVCSIPWGRICAAKALLSAYKNIAEWDDASAFEAFQNAKARYWAGINNLPCDIPLPNPQMYIEEVNHKAIIDPKLVEDLEKPQSPRPSDGKKEGRSGWDYFFSENKQTPAPAWGNTQDESTSGHHDVNWDKFVVRQCPDPGWDNSENHLYQNGKSSAGWNRPSTCRDVSIPDHSMRGGGNSNSWNNGIDPSWGQHWNNRNHEQGSRYNRKRSRGYHDSEFLKSRQTNNYQAYGSNRNAPMETNLHDYSYKKTMHGGQPVLMQQSKSRRSCGPVNNQRSNEAGGAWYWEKSATWVLFLQLPAFGAEWCLITLGGSACFLCVTFLHSLLLYHDYYFFVSDNCFWIEGASHFSTLFLCLYAVTSFLAYCLDSLL